MLYVVCFFSNCFIGINVLSKVVNVDISVQDSYINVVG